MKKILYPLIIALSCIIVKAYAQNPIITHMYTADPSARVFNDTLYVYPSHDPDTATWFSMVDWHVFSTVDMRNWTDHGVALSVDDLSWADHEAWAPDCEYRNGKYYFYYPVEAKSIGVAVGDKPFGPFTDPLDKPLITRETPGVINNRDLIDPNIFIDDDNSPYLIFGQNDVNIVKLNDDMISFDNDILVGHEGRFVRYLYDNPSSGQSLAQIVVAVTDQSEGDTGRQKGTKTLARRSAEHDFECAVREALGTVFGHDPVA